jgi:NhaP-type Na+/H+ or K+/H+ antiporter
VMGVGLILFVIILEITNKSGSSSFVDIAQLFAKEVLGGIIIGLISGSGLNVTQLQDLENMMLPWKTIQLSRCMIFLKFYELACFHMLARFLSYNYKYNRYQKQ